jgi:hypothetical protein
MKGDFTMKNAGQVLILGFTMLLVGSAWVGAQAPDSNRIGIRLKVCATGPVVSKLLNIAVPSERPEAQAEVAITSQPIDRETLLAKLSEPGLHPLNQSEMDVLMEGSMDTNSIEEVPLDGFEMGEVAE